MGKISSQNYRDCYEYGKHIVEGKIEIATAAMNISKTGMDIGSAKIYLRCIASMLKGERYTGTVNELATSYYLIQILSEYGFDGLRKALHSLKQHLEYQSKCQNLPAIQKIYDELTEVLP